MRFGQKLPVDIPVAARSAAKAALPKSILVRATEAFTSTQLLSQGKNKKHLGFIEEGQELVVSVREFRALSRFLELAEQVPEAVFTTPGCELPEN